MESSEEDFVRSLSHCVNWQARGGKSGAVFYATEGLIHELHEAFPKHAWSRFPFHHLGGFFREFSDGGWHELLGENSLMRDCVLSFVVR